MNENKSLILMVEDEEQVLNTNCRMLRRRGYDVRTAQTVSEVYHQLEEQLPDLRVERRTACQPGNAETCG